MRIIFAGLTLLIAASAAAPVSAEILYPWCRQPAEGGNYCGYSSEAQCQGESVGKGAFSSRIRCTRRRPRRRRPATRTCDLRDAQFGVRPAAFTTGDPCPP